MKRFLLIAGMALLLLVAAGLAFLSKNTEPWIRGELRAWAERNGYEKVEITGIGFRLFPLRASMTGLTMEALGSKVLEVEEAGIEIRLGRLLAGDLRIDSVSLRGAKVSVDVREDGAVVLAGLSLGGEGRNPRKGGNGQGSYRMGLLKITESALYVTAPNLRSTIHVSDLEFREGKEIHAGTVSFQGVELTVVRNADDTWRLFSAEGEEVAALGDGKKKEKGGIRQALSSLSLSIDKVAIAAGSTVTFIQKAPGDEYETTNRIDRAYITDLRSGKPESASSFVYETTSSHHERFILEGSVQLFREEPQVDIKGRLEGLELLPFSSFTRRAAGFTIDSGQADGDLEITIVDGTIEGLIDIRVNLLTISASDKERLRDFEKTLPKQIKLSTALRLLSDKKGVIGLKIPVSGDASAPSFDLDLDISRAVNNALGEIVQTGLLVAAPWAVATINALMSKRPPFQEVPFAPLSADIDERGERALSEFASRLSGRKDLLTLVCGFAVEGEMQSLAARGGRGDRRRIVEEIAGRRARAVKDRLVTGHGIEARRLILCRPELNFRDRSTILTDTFGDEDTREPRVELR